MMKSLKLPKEESGSGAPVDMEESGYGYGTTIRLEEEQVKALGLEGCAVGQKVTVHAMGYVASASIDSGESGTNMGIQFTDMEVLKETDGQLKYNAAEST